MILCDFMSLQRDRLYGACHDDAIYKLVSPSHPVLHACARHARRIFGVTENPPLKAVAIENWQAYRMVTETPPRRPLGERPRERVYPKRQPLPLRTMETQ